MLQIKNTIPCPCCQGILRVSVRVVSDGKEFSYYLCPKCQDVARQDPATDAWSLAGGTSTNVAEIVAALQALAVEEWRTKSTDRTFSGRLAWTAASPAPPGGPTGGAPGGATGPGKLGPRDRTVTKAR